MVAPKVTVLGCGPSGLVAAQAAYDAGYDPLVLTNERKKSDLWGCQYLHAPIPGITQLDEHVTINYQLDGTAEGYLEKVYGDDYDGQVSPQGLEPFHHAWDLRRTYAKLWEAWEDKVVAVGVINHRVASDVLPDFTKTGHVFSTIPRTALCGNPKHQFASTDVWAIGDTTEQRVPVRPPEDNMVICNGNPDVGWYRASLVHSYGTVEWPHRDGRKPPFSGISLVRKPLYTDCTCLPELKYVGRYGAWRKGVLVHQVYEGVTAALEGEQERLF